MFRLQYRNFGDYSTLVANHTVTANARASIRWYELRKTTTNWSIYQQGTWQPDNDFRWMGSIAMNANGNIAVGYSVSSSTTYPSIRYAGRTANAPLGQFNIPETTIVEGTSSQTNVNRWGDYSTMSIDPTDDSTFWYAQMYRLGSNWRTQFASFNFAPGVAPEVDAGVDQVMCIDQTTIETKATAIAVQSVEWETAGDGILLYTDRLETLYAAGPTDRTSGEVTLTITATGWDGSIVTDDFTLYIHNLPEAIAGIDTLICQDEVIELYGEAVYADSTIWITNGDGNFSDANLLNAVYTPGENDILNGTVELTLQVFASEVCEGEDSDVLVLTVDNCTGVDEQLVDDRIMISPNPTTGIFTLEVNIDARSNIQWELIDTQGKLLKKSERKARKSNQRTTIDASDLDAGTYFLKVIFDGQTYTKKVLIQ